MQKNGREYFVLQPSSYRKNTNVPEWMHFPKLHLLLGWGGGIWETLGEAMAGLRHVYMPLSASTGGSSLQYLFVHREQFFLKHWKQRDNAPTLLVEAIDEQIVEFRDDMNGLHKVNRACAPNDSHIIVPDGEYRVRHHRSSSLAAPDDPSGIPMLTLERQTKRLKERFQNRMAKFGVTYAPNSKRGEKTPQGPQIKEMRAFVSFVSDQRTEFLGKRLNQLLKDQASRPADFEARRLGILRSRAADIEREKRRGNGPIKKPLTEEQLLHRTCDYIARQEAAEMLYDFHYLPLLSLCGEGVVTWSNGDLLRTET